MTTDIPAAIAFYGKVVGWTTEGWGQPSEMPYTLWKTPSGSSIGGVFPLPEEAKQMGAPPNWMGNLCVDDVDACVAKVAELGGHVLQPAFDVPGVGRVAIVADPGRAAFALFQPAGEAPGHDGPPAVGEVSWCELYSTDPDAAWAFYSGLVGWVDTESMDMGPMGTYRMFGPPGGKTIGGMMRAPEGMPVSMWGYYFYVADLDASIETAKGEGAALLHGPIVIPGGDRVASLRDPQGAAFSLHGK